VKVRLSAIYLICFFSFKLIAIAGADSRPAISKIEHPQISGQTIYGLAGKTGRRAIALRNKIFMESQNGSTEIFDHSNSPLLEGGTITAIELTESDLGRTVSPITKSRSISLFR